MHLTKTKIRRQKQKITAAGVKKALLLLAVASIATFALRSSAASPVPWDAMNSTGCGTQGLGSAMTEISGTLYFLAGNNTTTFQSFNPATETCTSLSAFPTSASASGKLVTVDSNTILGFHGNNVYTYKISENRWVTFDRTLLDDGTPVSNSGATQNNGNSIVTLGSDLYILAGAGTTFQRYTPSTNTWTTLAVTLAAVNDGADMAVVGTDIYAFRGANTTTFWRFNGTSWSALTSAPAAVEAGGALASIGTDIYALRGNNTRDFWKYDTSLGTWDTGLASAPDYVYGGGSLVAIGTNVYALQGNNTRNFWRFSTTLGTWSTLSKTPGSVIGVDGLLTDGTDIYAFQGNDQRNFWKYTVATDTWSELPLIPLGMGSTVDISEGGGAYLNNVIYAVTGDGVTGVTTAGRGVLWRYPLTGANANTWPYEKLIATPAATGYGSAMVRPGVSAQDPTGDFLYFLRGQVTNSFWKLSASRSIFIPFSRALLNAADLISQDTPSSVTEGDGNNVIVVNGMVYVTVGSNTATFLRYNPTTNQWLQLTNAPDIIGQSARMVSTDSDSIYLVNSNDTFKYSISDNVWRASIPLAVDDTSEIYSYVNGASQAAGNRIVEMGGDFYMAPGNATTFQHFDPDGNTWVNLTSIPASASVGFSMATAGSSIYALRASTSKSFYRFDPSTNAWTTLTSITSTANAEEGAALAYPGSGDFLYALVGNASQEFWRYSISGNSWTQLANTPAAVAGGGALAILGNYAYAFRGNNLTDFWRYDITQTPGTDAWNTGLDPANAPAGVADGGSLATDGTLIYGTRGNNTGDFWSYNPANDTWTTLDDLPATVGSTATTNSRGSLIYSSTFGDLFATTGRGVADAPISDASETGLFYRYKLSAGSGQNTWPAAESIPLNPSVTFRGVGAAYPGTGNKFYISTSSMFWDYDANIEEWQTFDKAILANGDPIRQDGVDNEGRSTSIVYNGGLFYVIGTSNAFQEYNPTTNTWRRLADTPYPLGVIETGMMVNPNDSNKLLILNDAGNTLETEYWYSYDIPSDTWTTLETPMDPGCANMAYPGAGDWIYISACQSPAHRHSTWRYSLSKDLWVTHDIPRFDGYVSGNPATNPTPVADPTDLTLTQDGGAELTNASGKLYVLMGGIDFWEFDPSTNTWTQLTDAPESALVSGIEWGGGEKLYAFLDRTVNFYEYCLPGSVGCIGNTWTLLTTSLPGLADDASESTTWTEYSDLFYPDTGDFLYAMVGSSSNDFYRFCFQDTGSGCTVNTWTKMAEKASTAGFIDMASLDGNILYTVQVGSTTTHTYDISSDIWGTSTSAPATVDGGAALVADGTRIFATRGNSTGTFWRFDPGGGGWSDALADDLPSPEITIGNASSGWAAGGMTYDPVSGDIWLTTGRGIGSGSGFNYSRQAFLFRYKIDPETCDATGENPGTGSNPCNGYDEWPHYAAVADNNLGQFRPTALASSGLDNFLYLLPGQYETTFRRYTIEDKNGTPDRTAADPGPGTWTAMPAHPFATNGPLMQYANGFFYVMRGNFSTNFTRFDSSETNSATLIGTEISSSSPATWATIIDGSFTITIDGILRTMTGVNFTGVTTMNDVANVVQTAIRAQTASTEIVQYCTDLGSFNNRGYFIFRSATAPGAGGSVSVLGRVTGVGMDISGVSVQGSPPTSLAGSSGQVRVPIASGGDWEYCGAAGQPDNIPVIIGDTTAGSRSGGMIYIPSLDEMWVTHSSGDSGNVEGDNASLLWRYDVAANDWPYRPAVPDPPASFDGGGDLTAHGANTLFALRGANTNNFFSFDIPSNAWTNLTSTAPAPASVISGGSITSDGLNTLYATRGNNTTDFWRFDVPSLTWNVGGTPEATPAGMGTTSTTSAQGKILYNSGTIWMTTGHGISGITDTSSGLLYRHLVATDDWPVITDPTNPTITDWSGGSDLASTSGTDIYALKGRIGVTTSNFAHYNVSTDTWTTLADFSTPANAVGVDATDGAQLMGMDPDTLYAFRGKATNEFYRYDISANQWINPNQNFPVTIGSSSNTQSRGDLLFSSSLNRLFAIPGAGTIVYQLALNRRATIEEINGGVNPVKNTPFNVLVQATDTEGNAVNVTTDTTITLSRAAGTGTLGGTLSGIITTGTSQATISGVTYDTAESGVILRATATLGDALDPGDSSAFTVSDIPPSITTISPNSGPTAGGNSVTITGTFFQSGATVTFDGTTAEGVTFINSTELTVAPPQHTATGAITVVVANPDAQSDSGTYTYAAPAPALVTPNSGAPDGGTDVTITGTFFSQTYYQQPVTISNTGAALSNYQIAITLDTLTPVNAGKMRSDCGDLRILDTNELTNIPYYIESGCNTATTRVWTKVPSLPVGDTTIYAAYGRSAMTSRSNIGDVFIFADDFDGASLNTTKWPTTSGNLEGNEVSGGYLTLENGEGIFAGSNALAADTIWETSADPKITGRIGGALRAATTTGFGFVGDGGSNIVDMLWWSSGGLYAETNTGESLMGSYATGFRPYKITYRPTGQADGTVLYNYNNGQLTASRTGANAAGTLFPVMYSSTGTGAAAQWDYIYIRQYAATEPSSLIGAETIKSVQATFDVNAATNEAFVSSTSITATTPAHAAGAVNVTVTNTDGVSGTLNNGYTYEAATDPATSTFTASPASVPANGSTTSTLTATIKDSLGNVISGKTVTVAKTGGPGTPTITAVTCASGGTAGISNASGEACFTVSSTTRGTDVFTATETTSDPDITVTQTASVEFTCVVSPDEQCLEVTITSGSLTVDAPDNFTFAATSPPDQTFSKEDVTYVLNTNDVVTVNDLRGSSGFNLQVQAAASGFGNGAGDYLPLQNFYVVTTASTTGGTRLNGVEYSGSDSLPQNIVAPQDTAADPSGPTLITSGTFTTCGTTFASGSEVNSCEEAGNPCGAPGTPVPVDLMLGGLSGGEGRIGAFKQNVNYYLKVPSSQSTGTYTVTLTFTVTDSSADPPGAPPACFP